MLTGRQKRTAWACALLVTLTHSASLSEDDEILYGFKSEAHKRDADLENEPWIEAVSWHPRAFVFHSFLSDKECDHIVDLAEPTMEQSTVKSAEGPSVLDTMRTSSGTFIDRKADEIITDIEERISRFTQIPLSHQEALQVLRYVDGQKYDAHYDSAWGGSPRVATVLMYLSDVEEGGETVFTESRHWLDEGIQADAGDWSECASGRVAAKPMKGDALLFFTLDNDLNRDLLSRHAGCPVIRGSKWSATAWVHTKPFYPEELLKDDYAAPSKQPIWDCFDEHPKCNEWAKAGECSRNTPYMVGSPSKPGACRPSCGLCTECGGKDDRECIRANAAKLGDFLEQHKTAS